MGILMVYDVGDKKSFEHIKEWTKSIDQHASETAVKILVGNKCDIPQPNVSKEEGEALAKEKDVAFFEASAKVRVEMSVEPGSESGSMADKRV